LDAYSATFTTAPAKVPEESGRTTSTSMSAPFEKWFGPEETWLTSGEKSIKFHIGFDPYLDSPTIKLSSFSWCSDAKGLWNDLVKNEYINSSGEIQSAYYKLTSASQMQLVSAYAGQRDKIWEVFKNPFRHGEDTNLKGIEQMFDKNGEFKKVEGTGTVARDAFAGAGLDSERVFSVLVYMGYLSADGGILKNYKGVTEAFKDNMALASYSVEQARNIGEIIDANIPGVITYTGKVTSSEFGAVSVMVTANTHECLVGRQVFMDKLFDPDYKFIAFEGHSVMGNGYRFNDGKLDDILPQEMFDRADANLNDRDKVVMLSSCCSSDLYAQEWTQAMGEYAYFITTTEPSTYYHTMPNMHMQMLLEGYTWEEMNDGLSGANYDIISSWNSKIKDGEELYPYKTTLYPYENYDYYLDADRDGLMNPQDTEYNPMQGFTQRNSYYYDYQIPTADYDMTSARVDLYYAGVRTAYHYEIYTGDYRDHDFGVKSPQVFHVDFTTDFKEMDPSQVMEITKLGERQWHVDFNLGYAGLPRNGMGALLVYYVAQEQEIGCSKQEALQQMVHFVTLGDEQCDYLGELLDIVGAGSSSYNLVMASMPYENGDYVQKPLTYEWSDRGIAYDGWSPAEIAEFIDGAQGVRTTGKTSAPSAEQQETLKTTAQTVVAPAYIELTGNTFDLDLTKVIIVTGTPLEKFTACVYDGYLWINNAVFDESALLADVLYHEEAETDLLSAIADPTDEQIRAAHLQAKNQETVFIEKCAQSPEQFKINTQFAELKQSDIVYMATDSDKDGIAESVNAGLVYSISDGVIIWADLDDGLWVGPLCGTLQSIHIDSQETFEAKFTGNALIGSASGKDGIETISGFALDDIASGIRQLGGSVVKENERLFDYYEDNAGFLWSLIRLCESSDDVVPALMLGIFSGGMTLFETSESQMQVFNSFSEDKQKELLVDTVNFYDRVKDGRIIGNVKDGYSRFMDNAGYAIVLGMDTTDAAMTISDFPQDAAVSALEKMDAQRQADILGDIIASGEDSAAGITSLFNAFCPEVENGVAFLKLMDRDFRQFIFSNFNDATLTKYLESLGVPLTGAISVKLPTEGTGLSIWGKDGSLVGNIEEAGGVRDAGNNFIGLLFENRVKTNADNADYRFMRMDYDSLSLGKAEMVSGRGDFSVIFIFDKYDITPVYQDEGYRSRVTIISQDLSAAEYIRVAVTSPEGGAIDVRLAVNRGYDIRESEYYYFGSGEHVIEIPVSDILKDGDMMEGVGILCSSRSITVESVTLGKYSDDASLPVDGLRPFSVPQEKIKLAVGTDGRLLSLEEKQERQVSEIEDIYISSNRFTEGDEKILIDNSNNRFNGAGNDGRPLAVLIYPTLETDEEKKAFEATNLQNAVHSLIEHGYDVQYFIAPDLQQVVETLKGATQQKQASVVMFCGHGSQQSLTLSVFGSSNPVDNILATVYEDELKKSGISGCLEENGKIILVSCSTGKGEENADNLANMLCRIFSQASLVVAPTVDTNIKEIVYDGNEIKTVLYAEGRSYDAAEAKALAEVPCGVEAAYAYLQGQGEDVSLGEVKSLFEAKEYVDGSGSSSLK
ncbi:MAG: hypothetical protein WBE75_00445, partial [Candidatus Omnitrophota bacterium]